jgi:hypothetical protein
MCETCRDEILTRLEAELRALQRELEANLAERKRFNETLARFLRFYGFHVA